MDDLAYHSRLDSVLPGVVLAAQDLDKVLPDWSWDIMVGDTDCNSSTGPLQAVDMFYKNRCFHVFIYKVFIPSPQARCVPRAGVSLRAVTCQQILQHLVHSCLYNWWHECCFSPEEF